MVSFENFMYLCGVNFLSFRYKDMEALVLDLKKRYTYADYLSWVDDVRRELIDGFIKLFPVPVDIHAEVSYRITRQLGNFIESTDCGC